MDLQIDAQLDATNLACITAYMRSATRKAQARPTQGIVISHRDALYQEADALVGITKASGGGESAVLTFSLEQFDQPQE